MLRAWPKADSLEYNIIVKDIKPVAYTGKIHPANDEVNLNCSFSPFPLVKVTNLYKN